jgi:threonine aldolase
MRVHDFRSDTVTLPTPEMMTAVAAARLGDSARGDDPTVLELEALGCELTGKEDALFVPSGTMANLSAIIAHDCRSGEVIVEATAHVYNWEGGGLSAVAGAVPRPLHGRAGQLDPTDIAAAIRAAADLALAPTKLICLENTHNASGGTVMPVDVMAEIRSVAANARIPVHLDGARLFNAAAHLGVPVRRLCDQADSVFFALSKGIGAPVGAILAGNRPFMRTARRAARMLGGGMRQAGLIAAPAIVGLRDPYPQHARDHALAQQLARGLARLDPSLVDPPRVQTNIVNCMVTRFAGDAGKINSQLSRRGVLANSKGPKIRFVTHAQVDETDVATAIRAFAEVLESIPA